MQKHPLVTLRQTRCLSAMHSTTSSKTFNVLGFCGCCILVDFYLALAKPIIFLLAQKRMACTFSEQERSQLCLQLNQLITVLGDLELQSETKKSNYQSLSPLSFPCSAALCKGVDFQRSSCPPKSFGQCFDLWAHLWGSPTSAPFFTNSWTSNFWSKKQMQQRKSQHSELRIVFSRMYLKPPQNPRIRLGQHLAPPTKHTAPLSTCTCRRRKALKAQKKQRKHTLPIHQHESKNKSGNSLAKLLCAPAALCKGVARCLSWYYLRFFERSKADKSRSSSKIYNASTQLNKFNFEKCPESGCLLHYSKAMLPGIHSSWWNRLSQRSFFRRISGAHLKSNEAARCNAESSESFQSENWLNSRSLSKFLSVSQRAHSIGITAVWRDLRSSTNHQSCMGSNINALLEEAAQLYRFAKKWWTIYETCNLYHHALPPALSPRTSRWEAWLMKTELCNLCHENRQLMQCQRKSNQVDSCRVYKQDLTDCRLQYSCFGICWKATPWKCARPSPNPAPLCLSMNFLSLASESPEKKIEGCKQKRNTQSRQVMTRLNKTDRRSQTTSWKWEPCCQQEWTSAHLPPRLRTLAIDQGHVLKKIVVRVCQGFD